MSRAWPTNILIATDGSEASSKAAARAVEIAAATNARVHAVHVVLLPPHAPATVLEVLRKELRDDAEAHVAKVRDIATSQGVACEGTVAETDGSVYLAAPASDYVTGQTIFVDGGWTIW